MLVGPVFSAGSVTSERERQTLDLLLTTIITPWQILWGKLLAGLRVSSVLTMFLFWPVLLACLMVSSYWSNLAVGGVYWASWLLTCLTTAMRGAVLLGDLPQDGDQSDDGVLDHPGAVLRAPGGEVFRRRFSSLRIRPRQYVVEAGLTSPFAATFAVPLDMETSGEISRQTNPGDVSLLIGYVIFTPVFNQALLVAMVWLFQKRWRVSLT